ncbi:general substrate transporter [Mycena floridula]|nr:general substrate transporter [Mycena floridula]
MPRSYVVFAGLFASIGSFLFGYDTGIITTSIAHTSFKTYMGNPNDAMTGAIVSSYIGGETIGAIIQTFLGDRMGRKRFMQLMCFVVTLGTIIQTAAQNYGMFVAGRSITGLAVGALIATVPIYNSEISPPSSRGIIGGLSGVMIMFGTFAANWIGYACGFAPDGQFQWRFPVALQIPPGVILFIGLQWYLPESPRWLVRNNRDEDAKASFIKVRGDLSGPDLHKEFDDMREQIHFEQNNEVKSFKEAWLKYRKRVIVSIIVQSMTSLIGINVINYYQTTLYQSLGVRGQSILLLAGVYGTVGLIANLAGLWALDRIGRRKLLLAGSSGICVTLIYSSIMAREFGSSDNQLGKGFALLGLYIFTAIFYSCMNSNTWLYGSEVLPVFLRSKVMGIAAALHFIWNVGLTEAGPSAFTNIKENFYYVFVSTSFTAFIIIFFYFPETKGRTLEEIAAEFGDKVVKSDDPRSITSEKASIMEEGRKME